MPSPTGGRPLARRLLTLSTSLLAAAALTVTSVSAANADDHKTFPGSKPTWAKSSNDAGAPPVDSLLEGELQLKLKDEAGAQRLAAAVSTPGSPLYGHYVSPQSWIAHFSPSKHDYAEAIAYVKSYGLQVVGTPKSRLFIVYRGTASQFNAAFSSGMRTYRFHGKRIVAPSKAPQLPAAIASTVSAVDLAQIHHQRAAVSAGSAAADTAPTPAGFAIPCSTYFGQHTAKLPEAFGRTVFPTNNCGYTGPQIKSAYEANGLSGAGQSIGEVVWYPSPTIQKDVNIWSAKHGTAPLTSLVQLLPKQYYNVPDCGNDPVEESMDIEAMHGLAPKAKIVFSGAADCDYSIDTALSRILDDRLSSVVSNSYSYVGGEPTIDQVQAELHQQVQAVAEGIGLYYSTGDYGDNTSLGYAASANYFGTSPWVTAVGGATTEIGKNGRIAAQTGWGDARDQVVEGQGGYGYAYAQPVPGTFWAGAGGGVSTVFSEPSYQRGVVPDSVAKGMRSIPDIAADADPYSGLIVGYTEQASDSVTVTGPYTEEPVGGTSLSSPIVATEAVLVQQATGKRLGFINPLLYALARHHDAGLIDVLPHALPVAAQSPSTGNDYLVTSNQDSSLTTTKGWDDVTGIGTYSVAALSGVLRRY